MRYSFAKESVSGVVVSLLVVVAVGRNLVVSLLVVVAVGCNLVVSLLVVVAVGRNLVVSLLVVVAVGRNLALARVPASFIVKSRWYPVQRGEFMHNYA